MKGRNEKMEPVSPAIPSDAAKRYYSGVRLIAIDNPAKRNALDEVTRGRLHADLTAAMHDPDCRAILITGMDGSFCAGGDLPSMPSAPQAIRERLGEMHAIVRMIHCGSKPVVVAVEGVAYGSGLSLAAAADFVVAAENATFGCVFGKLALIPDTGLLWTLPLRVGAARARRLMLTNQVLTASEAGSMGLVDEVCPPGEACGQAFEIARRLADDYSESMALTKAMLTGGPGSLEELLAEEMEVQIQLLQSAEFLHRRDSLLQRNRRD